MMVEPERDQRGFVLPLVPPLRPLPLLPDEEEGVEYDEGKYDP